MVAKCRIPCEISTDIVRELASHPDELGGIGLDLPYATDMRVCCRDSVPSKVVNLLEIASEHFWMLLILGGDVLLDGSREGNVVSAAEGEVKDVSLRGVRNA